MAKTNFTKVEEALKEGLQKMSVNKLLGMTEVQKDKPSDDQLLSELQQDLEHLHKKGQNPYKKLGISKKELKELNPQKLSLEELEKLKKLKRSVEEFKKELDKIPHTTDEDLIQQEKRKHVNKRFNVRDNWLPLK